MENNHFIRELSGEEGAEKLVEVADTFSYKPYLWSFSSVDEPLITVSGLGSGWGLEDRLHFKGGSHGYDGGGFALGYVGKKFPQEIKAENKSIY